MGRGMDIFKKALGDLKVSLVGRDINTNDVERLYVVKGRFGGVPYSFLEYSDKSKDYSTTHFTQSGNVYIYTHNCDHTRNSDGTIKSRGTITWEDINSGIKQIYKQEDFGAEDIKNNGKLIGSKIIAHNDKGESVNTSAIKCSFMGDIRDHSSSAELVCAILEAVNSGKTFTGSKAKTLKAEGFIEGVDDPEKAPELHQISINQRPENLLIPQCFKLKSDSENDRHWIANKDNDDGHGYVKYPLIDFPEIKKQQAQEM